MKNSSILTYSFLVFFLLANTAQAKQILDCSHGASLAQAVARAEANDTITFTGVCSGPIAVMVDGLTLQGHGLAVIDGQKQTALTLHGVQNVSVANLEVRNGLFGILLDAQSQANLKNLIVSGNSVNGIDLENNSSATLFGAITTQGNGVFGINVNAGSNLAFNQAQVIAQQNVLGIQIGTSANAFISDPTTTISVHDNFSTGLTIVSGSHMVAFGGTITAYNNGVHGVSVDSKAGLDLDAAAVLETYSNKGDGVHLEESAVMTLFNTTAFSGAPGDTTLKAHDNAGNGIAVQTGSNFTLVHQVNLVSTGNTAAGVMADNGSGLTLLKANISQNSPDVLLSFGSRADIQTSPGYSVGKISCDRTVLLRGNVATTCPTP